VGFPPRRLALLAASRDHAAAAMAYEPHRIAFYFDLASEFRALWTLRHIYALAVRLRSLALPLKARKPQVESRVSEALHGMNA
jgi:hypothetical protein